MRQENKMYQYIASDSITGFYSLDKIQISTTQASIDVLNERIEQKVSTETFETLSLNVNDISDRANYAADQADVANGSLAEYKILVSKTYSTITQTAEQISQAVSKESKDINGRIQSVESSFNQSVDNIQASLLANGIKLAYFELKPDGFYIGQDGASVKLRETAKTIQFVEVSSGTVLAEFNTSGLISTQVQVDNQYTIQKDDVDIWAIRKGAAVSGKNNLNIVWMGG